MTSPRVTASGTLPAGVVLRRVRRPGMRGGGAYVTVPVVAAPGGGRLPARRAALYWGGAWAWAATLYVLLVGRVTEFVPFITRFRPVAIACACALVVLYRKTPPATWAAAFRHPQFIRCLLYFALAVITVPFAIWPGGSAGMILPMIYATVLVLVFLVAPADRSKFDRLTDVMLLGSGFTAVATVAAGAVVEGSRLTSTGSYDANDLAAFMNVVFFLALGRAARGKLLHRAIAFGLAALFVLVTLKTASRGGAISLGVGALVFLLGLGGRRFFIAVLVTALLAPIGWSVAPPTFRERISTIVSLDQDYNTTSTSGRSYIWKRGVVFFAHRPIIGVGAGGFETRLGRDFEAQGTTGAWHTAHNSLVQVFVELGLFGGVLFVWMIGATLREAARFWRPSWNGRRTALAAIGLHRPELLAAVTAYAVAAMFLSHAYSYLTYGIIAFGTYIGRVRRNALGLA